MKEVGGSSMRVHLTEPLRPNQEARGALDRRVSNYRLANQKPELPWERREAGHTFEDHQLSQAILICH
jgi:hypothetical protein